MGTPRKTTLTDKQVEAARRILEGWELGAIAAQLGISDSTLARWRRRPEFRAEIRAQSRSLWEDATAMAIAAKPLAIKVLRDLSNDDSIPSAVRRSAAADLARLGDSGMVAVEFAARLEALEGEGQDD